MRLSVITLILMSVLSLERCQAEVQHDVSDSGKLHDAVSDLIETLIISSVCGASRPASGGVRQVQNVSLRLCAVILCWLNCPGCWWSNENPGT